MFYQNFRKRIFQCIDSILPNNKKKRRYEKEYKNNKTLKDCFIHDVENDIMEQNKLNIYLTKKKQNDNTKDDDDLKNAYVDENPIEKKKKKIESIENGRCTNKNIINVDENNQEYNNDQEKKEIIVFNQNTTTTNGMIEETLNIDGNNNMNDNNHDKKKEIGNLLQESYHLNKLIFDYHI